MGAEKMDRNIRLLLQYDGGRYEGFAPAAKGPKGETIQGKLSEVLRKMTGEETEVICAERTLAGEHALEQVVNFHTDTKMKCWEIKHYLNRYLPRDIAVDRVDDMPERFHSMYGARTKTCLYRVAVGDVPCVFDRKYNYYCFDRLDIDEMRTAAASLIGRHDFRSFNDLKRTSKSTVREIFEIKISEAGQEIHFEITADGYLNHMVRIIVGTLLEIGAGDREAEEMAQILESGDRKNAGQTLPAQGLFLKKVTYEEI